MPYNRYTNLMKRSLVEFIIHSINLFPHKGSIRKRLGYHTILLGNPSTDFNKNIIFFGYYAMVYTGTTNTLNRRDFPSIYLRKSNEDVGHFLVSLYTRKYIHIDYWIKLPI